MNSKPSRPTARGFALVEVLVSLLVFSLGVLGMVALQARATAAAVDSEDRTRAALLVDDLVATMWAQRSSSVSTAALTAWATRLSDTSSLGLPGSPTYSVSTTAGVTTVTISWNEPTRRDASGNAATSSYSTQVVIP